MVGTACGCGTQQLVCWFELCDVHAAVVMLLSAAMSVEAIFDRHRCKCIMICVGNFNKAIFWGLHKCDKCQTLDEGTTR